MGYVSSLEGMCFEMFGFCLLSFVAFLFLVAQDTMGLCDTLCFLWQLSHKFHLVILAFIKIQIASVLQVVQVLLTHTLGWNPAPIVVGSLSHYLHGLIHGRWFQINPPSFNNQSPESPSHLSGSTPGARCSDSCGVAEVGRSTTHLGNHHIKWKFWRK